MVRERVAEADEIHRVGDSECQAKGFKLPCPPWRANGAFLVGFLFFFFSYSHKQEHND